MGKVFFVFFFVFFCVFFVLFLWFENYCFLFLKVLVMYKIYVNGVPVVLTVSGFEGMPNQHKDVLEVNCRSRGELLEVVRYVGENPLLRLVYILGDDIVALRDDFYSNYSLLDAAGGVVFSGDGRVLLIKRKGRWDLPKGKVEFGETFAVAALREVEEETGIGSLSILGPIVLFDTGQDHTCHTYYEKGVRVLKRTFWFKMYCGAPEYFRPQLEEGITEVCWVGVGELESGGYFGNMFGNVRDLLLSVLDRRLG